MSLKFLFFPIILIISVSIFFGYIWPEIGDLQGVNNDLVASRQTLQSIKDKQTSIQTISNQISGSAQQDSQLIGQYLPTGKMEEQAVGTINYLAADAGVSLVNIVIGGNQTDANSQGVQSSSSANVDTAASGAAAAQQNVSKVQAVSTTITVSGDYNKIQLFLDGIEKMPLYNNIRTLTISKAEKPKDQDPAVQTTDLVAVVSVDFGYVNSLGKDANNISKLQSSLDTDTTGALKKYISSKKYFSDTTNNTGKANPFLP